MATGDAAKKQQEVLDYIASEFGLTDAVLSMDKTDPKSGFTLKEACERIRKEKITDPNRAAEILAKTNWFKKYGVDVTKRLSQETSAPGVFARQVDGLFAQLRDRAASLGLKISNADLRKRAREAYVFQLNDSQVIDNVLKANQGKFSGGGSTGDALSQLDTFAYANGVSVSKRDKDLWAMQIIGGDRMPSDFEKVLREKAAQKYTVFGDQIRAGANLSDLTSAYRAKMADLLEVSPDNVEWDDPLFKDGKAFTTTDEKGQPAVRPLWEFEKAVKSDSRWQYTKNAHETYTNAGANLLKRFGMVA